MGSSRTATPTASGDLLAIEGFTAFYEERFDLARARLRVVARAFPGQPIGAAARFFLAAIAHRTGDAREARRLLAHVLETGVGTRILAAAQAEWRAHVRTALPARRARHPIAELGRDLLTGLRLVFIAPRVRLRRFTTGAVVRLLLFDVLLAVAIRAVDAGQHVRISGAGLALAVLPLVAIGAGARLIAGARARFRRLAASAYAAAPLLLVASFAVEHARSLALPTTTWRLAELAVAMWSLAVTFRVTAILPRSSGIHARIRATVVLFLLLFVPARELATWPLFRPPPVHVEQAERLAESEAALAPERAGAPDLYFVGAAGWAYQDVFLRETRSAQSLIAMRFDAGRRSIVLANDAFAQHELPPFTNASLRHALQTVGRRMNREEDVLFLYLTSHGSSSGLGLSFADSAELEHETLEPRALRTMLDDAGIRWRVIVVQGCESGVFIDALKDDATLLATAASSDRPSYGCAEGKAFTDFGSAFLAEKLPITSLSIADALREAVVVVGEREARDGVLPSRPQIAVGAAIEAKLRTIEAR